MVDNSKLNTSSLRKSIRANAGRVERRMRIPQSVIGFRWADLRKCESTCAPGAHARAGHYAHAIHAAHSVSWPIMSAWIDTH